jgi:hypothetical protein
MQAKLKQLGDSARANGVRLYLAMTPNTHNLADHKLDEPNFM